MSARHTELPGTEPLDAGMSLVEVLVAMGLFAVLSTILLGFGISTAALTDRLQSEADATAEARLAVQRLTRELRQAESIDGATLISAGGTSNAMTISVDFNDDGAIDTSAADPEMLTYRWRPQTKLLTLTANDASGASLTQPVLAGEVTVFDIRLRSSRWEHDSNRDGITTWQELDVSVLGNHNGQPDHPELQHIDLVSVNLTVTENGHEREFTIQSDLRNQRPQ